MRCSHFGYNPLLLFLLLLASFSIFYSLSGFVENAFHAAIIEGFETGFLCLVIFFAINPKTSVPPARLPVFVGVAIGLTVGMLRDLTGYVPTTSA
jgi:glycerol uptake facilitator-like aquaporin